MSEVNLPGLSIKTSDKPLWSIKAPEEGYWLRTLSDEALMKELEMRKHPLFESAKALVEAVERYAKPNKGEFCHRSELLIKCNQLKKILNEMD